MAEATPILWASKSLVSEELEFISRGLGTSCSTTEPVIKLSTAKVPKKRANHLLISVQTTEKWPNLNDKMDTWNNLAFTYWLGKIWLFLIFESS